MAFKRSVSSFLKGRDVPFHRIVSHSQGETEGKSEEGQSGAEGKAPSENKAVFDFRQNNVYWPDDSQFGPLTLYRRQAMAADFEFSFNEKREGESEEKTGELALNALDLVDEVENTLSVFRPTTLVSRINLLAAEMNICVPEKCFAWLELCRRIWEETDGAYDITASPLWRVWGFARHDGRVPAPKDLDEALKKVGMNHLRLNREDLSVAFDLPGVEINFGGIGKGIALDEASRYLIDQGATDFLVQGGKSSARSWGGRRGDIWILSKDNALIAEDSETLSRSREDARECWSIGIRHPLQPEKRLAKLRLVDSALGTSGSSEQFFFYKGKRLSHILDPKTGKPATQALAAIVLAPSAAEADALSTAFFVMGPDKTEKYCQTHPEIRVFFILETAKSPGYEVCALNFTPDILKMTD